MADTPHEKNGTDHMVAVVLAEYEKLKDEQTTRIGFRDNMIYVTLTTAGAIGAFAVSDASRLHVLLIIPWVCFVLGWTYLVNDEKISAIGRYIRNMLDESLQATLHLPQKRLFGWEVAHRSDERRKSRKFFQLLVDEITFCLSGLIAIIIFSVRFSPVPSIWRVLVAVEIVLLLVLGYQMVIYADLKKGE